MLCGLAMVFRCMLVMFSSLLMVFVNFVIGHFFLPVASLSLAGIDETFATLPKEPTNPSLCSKLLRLLCLADTLCDRVASMEVNADTVCNRVASMEVNMDRFVRIQKVERHWRCLIESVSEDGSVTEKTRRQTIPRLLAEEQQKDGWHAHQWGS